MYEKETKEFCSLLTQNPSCNKNIVIKYDSTHDRILPEWECLERVIKDGLALSINGVRLLAQQPCNKHGKRFSINNFVPVVVLQKGKKLNIFDVSRSLILEYM